jgi:hypothetical protein
LIQKNEKSAFSTTKVVVNKLSNRGGPAMISSDEDRQIDGIEHITFGFHNFLKKKSDEVYHTTSTYITFVSQSQPPASG